MIPRLRTGRRPDTVDDFPGVLIPLDEAHLHSHSSRATGSGAARQPDDDAFDDDGGPKDGDDEDTGMLEMSTTPEYSIEGLRKEVRRGGRGRQWTAYECEWKPFSSSSTVNTEARCTPVKSKLINKAIQDIGMGRYNWQLFVLCGFGWFADK